MNKTWTPAARETLERTLNDHHARLVGTGVDADEVVADLRRHVEAEIDALPGGQVEATEVRSVLERVLEEAPVATAAESASPSTAATRGATTWSTAASDTDHPLKLRRTPALWFFLVLLPLVTLGLEFFTGMCAAEFFDPIASFGELLAVAAVPAIFGVILSAHRAAWFQPQGRRFLAAALFVTGIGVFYALLFLPLTPFAVPGIIFGIGLLPLSPLLVVVLGSDLARQLARRYRAAPGRRRRAWLALPAAWLALLVVDSGAIVTSVGLRWYASTDATLHERGRAWLRSPFASLDRLHDNAAHGGANNFIVVLLGDFIGGSYWSRADAERAYFEATGQMAEEVPESDGLRANLGMVGRGGRDLSDPSEAREFLSLTGSRLDGEVDAETLTGYVEWTATLTNTAPWSLEGRAVLQLPPGGVVSRVTLWVNGEEREAAFGGRAQTTQAYEAVAIRQRRDPILVTTAGVDRVRLRCFPVPAGREMKFRIGVTFPLQLAPDGHQAAMLLPRLAQENFRVDDAFAHQVWMESDAAWSASMDSLARESGSNDRHVLRGTLRQETIESMLLTVARESDGGEIWGEAFDPGHRVVQSMAREQAPRKSIALVIDGSSRVWRRHADEILAGMQSAATGPLDVWIALDQPVKLTFADAASARDALARAFSRGEVETASGQTVDLPRRGGFANGATVAAALGGLGPDGGTVIWIHGTQCNAIGNAAAVRQILDRRGAFVTLLAVPIDPLRNDLLEELDGEPQVRGVAPFSGEVLRETIDRAAGLAPAWVARREVRPLETVPSEARARDDRHLARLWAAGEVTRLAGRGPEAREMALKLAVTHQIVTPVTGAVVLETKEQYQQHGLTPVDPTSVPTIPDHASVWTVVIAALALVLVVTWARSRRRNTRCPASA